MFILFGPIARYYILKALASDRFTLVNGIHQRQSIHLYPTNIYGLHLYNNYRQLKPCKGCS